METETIQLDLKKLNEEFNKEVYEYYEGKKGKIVWDDKYNIKNELDKIKEIWKDVLFAECEKVIKSKANNKNVNEEEVKKFYNENFKQYENDWGINYSDTDFGFFFEAFEEKTINTPQKVDQLVDFIKNDLKLKNTIRDRLPILAILKLIKSDLKDDLFKILELNEQKNLSPDVLSECVSKFELDCNTAEKLLSFGENYKLPELKDGKDIYREEVDDFFRLLWCTLNNTRALFWVNTVKNLEILQRIFTYINKDMPQFKPFFGKIDNENKYTWRKLFFERLGICCIKIYLSEEKSNDGDIKIEINYFQWFNQFVSYKLRDDNLDRYKENYDKFVSEFSDEVKKYNIEMTGDIKKQLMFNNELLNKTISQINQMKLTNAKEKINKEGNNTNIEKEIKINSKGNDKNKIDKINQSKKFDSKNINFKLNELEMNKNDEKHNTINVTININDEDKSEAELTYSINNKISLTDDKNDNTLNTNQKIDSISAVDNSKHKNIQNQHIETTFISTTKTSYPKLILKIVLYALAVVAFAAFVFSIIKAFWFLTILSFILCFCFAFIAYKIKYKTIDERPNQIGTGDLNYQQEITKPKNNELNQEPETAKDGEDKNDNSFSPNQNQK